MKSQKNLAPRQRFVYNVLSNVILGGKAMSTLLAAESSGMIVSLIILFACMYFFMIRPQQKEMKNKNAMLAELAVGDTVLTSSGFYGVVINITADDDTIIVEFGNNRNCRIPMQKSAVVAVEKPDAE